MTLTVLLGCRACGHKMAVKVDVTVQGDRLIADDERLCAWRAAHHLPYAVCP